MAKDRWVTDEALGEWFDAQMRGADTYGGDGSAVDAICNFVNDEAYMSHHLEGLKAIDVAEMINAGVHFGQDAERLDCKIFYFYNYGINWYFLAKNKTEFKKLITSAINEYKEACEPIGEPEPTRDEIIESLLKDIYTHIRDPKGRSDMEANWAERIEELGYGS